MKDFFTGFVGTLCIAAMLGFVLASVVPMYWSIVVVVAIVVGISRSRSTSGARSRGAAGKSLLGSSDFLCDTCKYNHSSTCSVPDRPNATECEDYKRKGT